MSDLVAGLLIGFVLGYWITRLLWMWEVRDLLKEFDRDMSAMERRWRKG